MRHINRCSLYIYPTIKVSTDLGCFNKLKLEIFIVQTFIYSFHIISDNHLHVIRKKTVKIFILNITKEQLYTTHYTCVI